MRERIEQTLEDNEKVEWAGTPQPRYFSRGMRKGLIFCAIVLTFAVFRLAKTLFRREAPALSSSFVAFLLFGFGAIAIGVYLAFSPLREYRKWLR